jgi:hypothetical protein
MMGSGCGSTAEKEGVWTAERGCKELRPLFTSESCREMAVIPCGEAAVLEAIKWAKGCSTFISTWAGDQYQGG